MTPVTCKQPLANGAYGSRLCENKFTPSRKSNLKKSTV